MLASLLIVFAAQALADTPPTRDLRPQVFIAPSGEAYRAPGGAPYPVADWFARADADHDGKLTEAEFDADFLRFFASVDSNHDGVIDGTEIDRYENATPELRSGGFARDRYEDQPAGDDGSKPARALGSYMSDSPQGGGRFDLLRIPEPVASMDTELKGRITRQQAQDAADYRFSLLDTKHRGYLVLAELPETFAQTHHGRSERSGERHDGRHGGHRGEGGMRKSDGE